MKLYEWKEIDGRLELYFPEENQTISLDWQADWSYHLRQHYSIRKEPLARALGIKGDVQSKVWDLTCGTGKDALLMLSFGVHLCAFERQAEIFKLLQNAHSFLPSDLKERFALFEGEARLLDTSSLSLPDVLYFDPMYEQKEGKARKALPRKEMRLFRELAGEDLDARETLAWALGFAKEKGVGRVVVKHPVKAKPLLPGVTASYEGKSTAYDLYRVL